jgi:hypothetical protein
MQYSTLQEAYNIGTFKQHSTKKRSCAPPTEPLSTSHNNQHLYSMENSSLSSNKESVEYMQQNVQVSKNNINKTDVITKGNSSCAPLQAPMYTIPVSGDCKKERDAAIKTYTEENFKSCKNESAYDNYENSGGFIANNGIDNVRPFYDEDMEQYFDINNLKDEVNYKSKSDIKINDYMPNHNKSSYTNDNTNDYSNNKSNPKKGINLLNNNEYNLSEEEKLKAREALEYLKSIENKINNIDEGTTAMLDSVKKPEVTGPGGFTITTAQKKQTENIKSAADDEKLTEIINENKKTESILNTLINIFIFVFIGTLIILLCDYIAELAIQIGKTKTANILDPYIKYHMMYMQHLANNNIPMMPQGMPQGMSQGMPMMFPNQNIGYSIAKE